MRLRDCAIAVSFSMSFAMSYQRLALSLRSQAAQASMSFILLKISRAWFSNLPILIPMPLSVAAWVKATGIECTRAHCPGRLAFGLANRISRRDCLHQHGPHFALGGDARIDERGCRDPTLGVAALSLRPVHTRAARDGPSNQAFDRSLRDRNANWGLRDLEAVVVTAQSAVFSAPVITEMPANNLSVVFRRL